MPLSVKENFMRCITGNIPEFVPRYSIGPVQDVNMPQQCIQITCSVYDRKKSSGGYNQNIWGVEYIGAGIGEMPVPGKILLEDIRNWRDIVVAPDISDVDWEAVARKDLDKLTVDPSEVALIGAGTLGYFINLMNLMGFVDGLLAFYEEPDEVKALFSYFNEFYTAVNAKFMDHYPIDVFYIGDDTATAINPFISPDMYREFIKPFVMEDTRIARERGLPIMMHNCGRSEDFVDDWIDCGICCWTPAQTINKLEAVKAKYGNNMVLAGCWGNQSSGSWEDVSEDFLRSEVRRVIDTFAPGGGYIFSEIGRAHV